MSDKKCREYLDENNINLIITDIRAIKKGQLELSRLGKIYAFIKKGFLDTLHDSMRWYVSVLFRFVSCLGLGLTQCQMIQ